MAGNTVSMYINQSSLVTFSVTGSDSAAVAEAAYEVTYTVGTAGIIGVTINPFGYAQQHTATVVGLTAGTTTLTFTLTPKAPGYTGSPLVLPADTITVSAARTFTSGSDSYSTPA